MFVVVSCLKLANVYIIGQFMSKISILLQIHVIIQNNKLRYFTDLTKSTIIY